MEEPTFTAIDYNSLENKVIEGLVRDNYSKIKNTFYKVFDKRVKNPNSPVGLCADLIEASNYKDDPDRILWRKVIKSWYQIWITDLDMNCIERYFKGYNEVKRWWLPNLQMWYVFFYRKNGNKVRGVLGRERTNDLLRSIL